MKQLTCEMCGSIELIKQDGMFVCQSCGTKYSVEEAKKMMVEGTVRIDNSEKLKNYYTLARQARDTQDAKNAEKYYDLIKQEDPNSWEAYFYNVYFRAYQTSIANIKSACLSIGNSLDVVFDLIKNSSDSEEEKKTHTLEVGLRVTLICTLLHKAAISAFKDSSRIFRNDSNRLSDAMATYAGRSLTAANVLLECGDKIERDYDDDDRMTNGACKLWEAGIEIWKVSYGVYDNHYERYSTMKSSYVTKIKKYQSDYVFSAPVYPDDLPYSFLYKKNTDLDFAVVKSSPSPSGGASSGGCYVATAVYGSYDCPQVWTLRRYRDYTLAETWYGRAFIHIYYAISPTIVRWFGNTEWFRMMWKSRLDHMVERLRAEGVEDTPYEDRNW